LTIIARTLNEENASNAILRKFGFQFAGEHSDPDDGSVWQWELRLTDQ
jgi:RimJ/RimL family protein N-acetyltransferase